MEVSDSLHVQRLTVGGSAQQAGVPVPSTIVEVAGQKVSTKSQLVQVLTTEVDGTLSPSPSKLVPFVFSTSLASDEVVQPTTNGSKEALTKLSQPDEVLLLQEIHSKEMAARNATQKYFGERTLERPSCCRYRVTEEVLCKARIRTQRYGGSTLQKLRH